MKRLWKRHILYFIGILLMMIELSCSSPESQHTHKVVVIQSFETEYRGYADIENQILKEFQKQDINADIDHFYLDCESYQSAKELERMKQLLDTIASMRPELILVYDDQATYSLMASEHVLAHQIPIVFAGVNFPNWNLLNKYPNITGFWDKPEFIQTAQISEELFGPMRINFWLDNTYLGRQATSLLLQELKKKGENRLGSKLFQVEEDGTYYFEHDSAKNNVYGDLLRQKPEKSFYSSLDSRESSANSLLWALSGLSRNSIFVQTKRDYTSKRLGLLADNPTLTTINEGFGLGEGLLGGYITSIESQIQLSVETASQILKGRAVSSIPIIQSPKEFILDWQDIVRWGVSLKSIPANYRIINMPLTERYNSHLVTLSILAGIIIISVIYYLIRLYLKENNERRQAQKQLRESEQFLSLALAGGKVFAFQLKKRIFYFDSDFYNATGLRNDLISIEKFHFFLHPEDLPIFNKNIEEAYLGTSNENISQVRCKFDGKIYQWWEFRYTYNQTDNIFSGLCLNIQQVKATEQELINARKKAEESDKMKSAFLANMSHEIRTPLNAIVGFSNIIGSGEIELDPIERNEFLQLINTNCDLLLKLINDILDLSRIESGHMAFNFEDCNLTDLMDDIYKTHRMLMPAEVELRKTCPEIPIVIRTDRHRLTQVITNFINNAGKFTLSGYIEIKYTAAPDMQSVLISVKDTGKGIAKEKQALVFDRFQKLDEFVQGTGLGLAICKTIIKRFNGTITVESNEGEGSTFTISLPYTYQT